MDRAAGPVAVQHVALGPLPWLVRPVARRRQRAGPGRPAVPATRSLPGRYGPAADRVRRRSTRRPRARETQRRTMTHQDPSHPALALNDTVHQRVRLAILTVLSEAQECKFATLRDELGLT